MRKVTPREEMTNLALTRISFSHSHYHSFPLTSPGRTEIIAVPLTCMLLHNFAHTEFFCLECSCVIFSCQSPTIIQNPIQRPPYLWRLSWAPWLDALYTFPLLHESCCTVVCVCMFLPLQAVGLLQGRAESSLIASGPYYYPVEAFEPNQCV